MKISQIMTGKEIIVLLFGSEGYGLKEKTSKYIDYPVKIKINDKIESLNIANSASVVFFHINKAKKNLDY